jgi:hypothetical protein
MNYCATALIAGACFYAGCVTEKPGITCWTIDPAYQYRQEPLTEREKTKVPGLIMQLGARDYHARQSAELALIALGKGAIPFLRKETNNPDPEVQYRVRNILAKLCPP